jgi:hypothetical protein
MELVIYPERMIELLNVATKHRVTCDYVSKYNCTEI